MQRWLSSTYLYHHLGGRGAEIKALSSTCFMTKFAKIALTGEPIGHPNLFVEGAINDEVVVLKHNSEQNHDAVNRHVCSFRDGRISFKSVLSQLESPAKAGYTEQFIRSC